VTPEAQRPQEAAPEAPRPQEVALEAPKPQEPRREGRPEPRQVEPEAPKIDAKKLLESSGLVMIETDRSKAVYQPEAEEPPHLGRPRRERPKPPPEEELQQVETRK